VSELIIDRLVLQSMVLALGDLGTDFLRSFEPVSGLTPESAWQALLAQARQPVARTITPHSADDIVVFSVSEVQDGLITVSLERRVARITPPYDYDGTLVFGCHLTMAADDWDAAVTGPWSVEGHVSSYERVDGADDRPDLRAFADEVQASAQFRAFLDGTVVRVRLAAGQA
jgi:hypothetical protein